MEVAARVAEAVGVAARGDAEADGTGPDSGLSDGAADPATAAGDVLQPTRQAPQTDPTRPSSVRRAST